MIHFAISSYPGNSFIATAGNDAKLVLSNVPMYLWDCFRGDSSPSETMLHY